MTDEPRAAWDTANTEEPPPRDDLVRSSTTLELIRSSDSEMPMLHGTAAVFDEWTEIQSAVEGHFFERFKTGSFQKTIGESYDKIRCLFHHGQDPSVGVKVLGPITSLREENGGLQYDVQLLDTDYCRSLIPGLEAGLYGSSFRFGITRADDNRRPTASERNPKRILERTIGEARLRELGPTPLPQYDGTSAGIRSLTDEVVLGRFPTEVLLRQLLDGDDADIEAMRKILDALGSRTTTADEIAELDDASEMMNSDSDTAPSIDAALVGTSSRSAASTTTGLYGLDRDEEDAWRL